DAINASSDSRTDTSSSTTNTTGAFDTSRRLDCLSYRTEQSRFAERFDEAAHGTGVHHPRAFARVFIGGDEHDRDRLIATPQLALQIRSGHSGHGDVQHQTPRLIHSSRREELLGRCE